jgi:hypothetical protein
MSYKEKYLKYKTKYSLLKEQKGGGNFLTEDDYHEDPSYAMFNFSEEFLERDINISILLNSFFQCYAQMYISFYHLDIFNGNRQLFLNYIEFLKKFILITNFFRIARELTKRIDDIEIKIYKSILCSTSINPKKFLSELKSISTDIRGDPHDIFMYDIYPIDKEIELWNNLISNFLTFETFIKTNSKHPTTDIVERDKALNYDRRTFEYEKKWLVDKRRSADIDDPINSKLFLDYLNEQILAICSKNKLECQGIKLYIDYYINIKRRENIVEKIKDNFDIFEDYRNKIRDMFTYYDYNPITGGVSPPSKLPEATKRLVYYGYRDLKFKLYQKYSICLPKS